jgi:hypothetical protein
MKENMLTLIASFVINLTPFAQSAGDYRSVGNGNWNDAATWEIFDGISWVSTTTYPGENPGTGAVIISPTHEIRLIASVPYPVADLTIDLFYDNWTYEYYYGVLIISAENAVSLSVSGPVEISGTLNIDDKTGSKSHILFVGGSLNGYVNGINGDDKLSLVLNSTIPNTIIGGGTFQDVTFNGNLFAVQGNMDIHGNVSFMNGIVNTYDYEVGNAPEFSLIRFRKGATWSGASNISYIDGWVGKEGDEPFTFPVGESGIYAPLTISAPVGQSEIFFARYNRASGSELGGITDPGLFNVSQCEYWDLMPGNGQYTKFYPLSITVGWNGSSGCGTSPYITNVSDVTLAHFNSTTWNSHGGTATGTAENGSVTWSGVTTFSPFALGNIGTCKTPSGLTATNITGNGATLSWSPEPSAVSYDVFYANHPSAPVSYWNNVATETTATSANLSGLTQSSQYYYRVRANCGSGSSSYRQSAFSTLTVCERPTGLATTNITNVSATLNWAAVPGATSYHVDYEYLSVWIPVNVVITSTSYLLGGLNSGSYYRWRVRANCPLGSSHDEYSQQFYTSYSFCNDVYEINNVSGQAKEINLGTTISATINPTSDVDWFKVTMPNGRSNILQVTLSNLSADFDLFVYDKNLNLVGSSSQWGIANEIVSCNSQNGRAIFYIKVLGKNGSYDGSQCYNLLAQAGGSGSSPAAGSVSANAVGEQSDKGLLYPNPASEFVMLHLNSIEEGSFNIQIFNTAGQLIKQSVMKITKGYNHLKIAVNDIRQGMYLLRINKGELSMIRKFVIAR